MCLRDRHEGVGVYMGNHVVPGEIFIRFPPMERIGLGFAANCKVVWMGDFSIIEEKRCCVEICSFDSSRCDG